MIEMLSLKADISQKAIIDGSICYPQPKLEKFCIATVRLFGGLMFSRFSCKCQMVLLRLFPNMRFTKEIENYYIHDMPLLKKNTLYNMYRTYMAEYQLKEDIVRNYRKELKRRRNKEISYCELPEIVVEKLAVWDEYESDYTAFDVCGIEVRVLDDDLAEAIKYLSEKDREILLMYFFLGMSDTEIGDRLKINRSTSFRSRKNSLEELKKKLKENMNDE